MKDGDIQSAGTETAPVRVKGVGDSLQVTFDARLPEIDLTDEMVRLFTRMGALAKGARVVLKADGEGDHSHLTERLSAFISERWPVSSCGATESTDQEKTQRIRQRQVDTGFTSKRGDVLVVAGRVRGGQKMEAPGHLVILGDVNPGGLAMAGGDILVLGSLRGTAMAGQPANHEAVVFALDFRPTQVQIGEHVAAVTDKGGGKKPEYAHLLGDGIRVDDWIRENPFRNLPWPEVR